MVAVHADTEDGITSEEASIGGIVAAILQTPGKEERCSVTLERSLTMREVVDHRFKFDFAHVTYYAR
ncbi:MAG: hypothetical protein NVS4B3_16740 [Gemmatimonadaceae bacterium]